MALFTSRYILTSELYDAGLRLLRRRYWPRLALVGAALLAATVIGNFIEDPVIAAAAITALVILSAVILAAILRIQSRRRAMVARFAGQPAEVTVTDDGVRMVLPEQEGFRRWSLLQQIWCGDKVWILFWHGASDPVLMPATVFAGAAGEFARAKALAVGARLRNV